MAHRSASAALGSSRPAAIRRNVCPLFRSSGRAYIHFPSSLVFKYSGASLCAAANTARALAISFAPTKQFVSVTCGCIISGWSLSARDAQPMPSAYFFAPKLAKAEHVVGIITSGIARAQPQNLMTVFDGPLVLTHCSFQPCKNTRAQTHRWDSFRGRAEHPRALRDSDLTHPFENAPSLAARSQAHPYCPVQSHARPPTCLP